ncbi:MAG: site-2 protease family protein [Phototrophicaceae bacterium]
MLRESASNPQFIPPPPPFTPEETTADAAITLIDPMRQLVTPYMTISREDQLPLTALQTEDQAILLRFESSLVVSFAGYLKQEAEQIHTQLDNALKPHDRYVLLRQNVGSIDAPHIIHIIEGRLTQAKPARIWLNIVLLILTIMSVFFTGAQQAVYEMGLLEGVDSLADLIPITLSELWRGYPYALSILAILIAHEMGHYVMMRRHGLQGTLPFFIPAPIISPFGTFGATIMLNDVLKNRKALLDVGAAGPLAGFIVAVPLVIYGLATSEIVPLDPTGMLEGNSLLYLFAKIVALGQIYPTVDSDVLLNQVAFAGWTGLFITALNMIPLGQLDGGHIMYALFGDRARWAFVPVVLALLLISIFSGQMTWVLFLLILFFIGRFYAVPLDTITPLDTKRQVIGIVALVIFVITFTPLPFYNASMIVGDSASLGMMIVVGFVMISQRLRYKFIIG